MGLVVPPGPSEGTTLSLAPPVGVTAVMSGRARTGRFTVRATRVLSGVVVVAMLAAALRLREALVGAVTSLLSLPFHAALAILACWGAVVVARSLLYRWSLPASTLARGAVLDQVGLAVGNSVPGGGVLSGMLRYRIGRSFGHGPDEIAVCLLAVGEAMSVSRWLLVVAVVGLSVVAGAGSGFDVAVLGSAVLALGTSAALWFVLARDIRPSRWVVRVAQGVADRLGRRVRALRDIEVQSFAVGLRAGAAWIVSARMLPLLAAAAVVTTGGAAMVTIGVQAVGGPDAPSTLDIVRVYLLARLAAGFSPTPGGVGVVEGALAAGLVAAGADPASAMAGILVYRGLTYAVPIVSGSTAYLWWRRWDRRHRFDRSRHPAGRRLAPAPVVPAATLALVPPLSVVQTGGHGTAAGGR